MILQRHRKQKQHEITSFRPHETMEDKRGKIQNLSVKERRDRNRSNVSAQAPQGSFLSMTLESSKMNPRQQLTAESIDSEELESSFQRNYTASGEENSCDYIDQLPKSQNIRGENVHPIHIQDPLNQYPDAQHDKNGNFWMSAPRQLDINKLRQKVDLPPIDDLEVD